MGLEVGARLAQYEILGVLGAGGMGTVFRARDTTLRRDVALKVLTAPAGADRAAADRLLREARAAAALTHPHICAVHEVGEAGGVPFIAMELVKGDTLDRLIARGRLPPDRVCRLGRQLAEALEHAHAHGVIHRDLKGANIVVTSDGRAKVLDFGIADLERGAGEDTRTTTRAGERGMAGTLHCMAPELLRGAEASIQSDLWALGIVLYTMSAGRPPFAPEAPDLVAAILRDPPPPLPSGTPSGLARVVMKCLAKEPGERPGRAGEVALALEVADPQVTGTEVESAPTLVRTHWHRRGLALVALAAAAVAVAYWVVGVGDSASAVPRLLNAVKITGDIGVEDHPSWSPDGRTLAFHANPVGDLTVGNWDVWVTQAASAPVNRTADHAGRDMFPSWSPDGSLIAFWSDRDGGGCFVMPALAGSPRLVWRASALDPNPPRWSRDGASLACVAGDPPGTTAEVVSLRTSQVERRFAVPGEGRRMFLAWSPDESRIAVVTAPAGLGGDVNQLWVGEVRTGRATAITDGRTKVGTPFWSPDGRHLYFVDNAGGNMDLWRQGVTGEGQLDGARIAVTAGVGVRGAALSADGRRLAYSQGRRVANVWRAPILSDRPATWADAHQITFDQAYIEFLDLSHDGARLAVSSDRSGNHDLWILPSGGGEMRQITSDVTPEWGPRWSPDDLRLAFFAFRTGNREMWTMPAAGGPWTQLTDNPGPDLTGVWSPDGREIAHLTERPGFLGLWLTPATGGPGRPLTPGRGSPSDWSADGRYLVTLVGGRIALADVSAEGRAETVAKNRGFFGRFSRDASRLFYVAAEGGNLWTVRRDGTDERPVTDFTGRRGAPGVSALATDGRYLYFTWAEDVGDIWTMDVQIGR